MACEYFIPNINAVQATAHPSGSSCLTEVIISTYCRIFVFIINVFGSLIKEKAYSKKMRYNFYANETLQKP